MTAGQTNRQVDLNADLGEEMGDDAAMLSIVSSANVACGLHAGGPQTMLRTFQLARARGVAVGAHPGYDDRANFGRLDVALSAEATEALVAWQVGAACGVAALAGHRISYVKTHGALYNRAAVDAGTARAVARAVRSVDPGLRLLCPAGSEADNAAEDQGLAVAAEAFADRAYDADGRLVPRGRPGAVIHDADQIAARALEMLETGEVPTIDGGRRAMRIDSLCLHGDTPGSVAIARCLRAALEGRGWHIAPFAP
jgi:UPF0271 protein